MGGSETRSTPTTEGLNFSANDSENPDTGEETLRSTGSQLGSTYIACLLAEAHLRAGRAETALELLEGALAASRERGELQLESDWRGRFAVEFGSGTARSEQRASRVEEQEIRARHG